MKKTCETCGRTFDGLSWESNKCYSCRKTEYAENIKEQLLSGEIDSTDCEDEVICPWCGEVMEPDCESSGFYEDGTHVMQCWNCDKEFTLETSVSYSYSTERELPSYVLEDRKRAQEVREKMRKLKEEV